MGITTIISFGILILIVLQICVSIYCIYLLISEINTSDDFIVHEVDFDDLSKEEQEALLKFMGELMKDD